MRLIGYLFSFSIHLFDFRFLLLLTPEADNDNCRLEILRLDFLFNVFRFFDDDFITDDDDDDDGDRRRFGFA